MLELFAGLLGKVLPDVLGRVLPPEKMTEAESAQVQLELTKAMMAQNWDEIEAEYKDRDSARNLAAQDIAKGNAFTGLMAATVRPIWGFGAFALVTYSVVTHIPIAPQLQDIIQTVLYFYFGGRTLEKITPHVAEAATRIAGAKNA